MGRFTDNMTRLREEIDSDHNLRREDRLSRVSIVRTVLADYKLNRITNTARDARERAVFVAGNSSNVNRLLKGFHDSRLAIGKQDRADRTAFVSGVVKTTAGLLTQFSNDHKRMSQHAANERASFIAENATSTAAFIKDAAQDRAGAHTMFFGAFEKKKA